MSLFRFNSSDSINGPHQGQQIVQTGADLPSAEAAMIMIHGRGASAQSIVGLANEFKNTENISFIAPQAEGNTWYPHSFLAPTKQNQPGLNSGLQVIGEIITDLESKGIPKDKIFLLGFSQGACLASEFAARHPDKYAGVIALSGGVIGESVNLNNYSGDLKNTPVFIGCSDIDPHIPAQRIDETEEVFNKLGADVNKKIYPGMGHSVNSDEIAHINELIKRISD